MKYFILINNSQQGPYSLEELRDKPVESSTLVWAEGMQQWTPAWQVEQLAPLFRPESDTENSTSTSNDGPTPPPVPPTTNTPPMEPSYNSSEEEPDEHHHRMPRFFAALALIIIVIIGLVATCPDSEKHREAVSQEISLALERHYSSSEEADGWNIIGNLFVGKMVDVVINEMLHVDNYVICSVGRLQYEKEEKTISFGILGHVFTFDSDDVERILEENDNEN